MVQQEHRRMIDFIPPELQLKIVGDVDPKSGKDMNLEYHNDKLSQEKPHILVITFRGLCDLVLRYGNLKNRAVDLSWLSVLVFDEMDKIVRNSGTIHIYYQSVFIIFAQGSPSLYHIKFNSRTEQVQRALTRSLFANKKCP